VEVAVAPPPAAMDDSRALTEEEAARSEPGRSAQAVREAPPPVAQAPPPERTAERPVEPPTRESPARAAESARTRDDAAREEASRAKPPEEPAPGTRRAEPGTGDAAPSAERSADTRSSTQLPVKELPAARPQPTAAAVRPPSAPPPQAARPVEARPPAVDPRQEVLAALGRYRAAYESLDAGAVAQVFTGADVRELQRAFRQYKTMKVQIGLDGCQTSVDGLSATASCDVTRFIDPKAGQQISRSQRETFRLKKVRDGWVVESVR
jgi:hypothetical protein